MSGFSEATATEKRFPCHQCGAILEFEPGTTALKCKYCGFVNEIPQSAEQIQELDFNAYLEEARKEAIPDQEQTVKCSACGAEFTARGDATSDTCPFCGSHAIIAVAAEVRIRPKSLLPFKYKLEEARVAYENWLKRCWLAPNDLKKFARETGGLQGMYIPYWTYDSNTTTWYQGMRGIYYYTTETYRDSNGNTQTRQVRHTAWTPCSGTVFNQFDDVLVNATDAVPPKHAQALKDWDLPSLVPYQDAYLSCFRTVRYKTGLEQGFAIAQDLMQPTIDQSIRYDIGGDEQQITDKKTQYDDITFKHILLPVWLGAYKFRDKTYSFLVNARTGEVRGDAPISFWKVLGLVILGLLIIGGILYLKSRN
jgi:DNA-directed RNA polymerase subunit RPC12/RpoP